MLAQPETKDYVRLGTELSIFSYTQFFYHQINKQPKVTSPNNFDSFSTATLIGG